MLIRASGLITNGLYLFTFGRSCHYCITTERGFYLFDPGLTAHVPALLKRLNDHGLLMRDCLGIILTHLDPDRVSAAAHLRTLNKKFKIYASPKIKLALNEDTQISKIYEEDQYISEMFELERTLRYISLSQFRDCLVIDKTIEDSEVIEISEDLSIRAITSAGHSKESLNYLIEPINFLITDESVGYYNGRELPSPGCDFSIESNITTLEGLMKLEISGLCMPNIGVLTASLIPKHLSSISQITKDLKNEVIKARASGISEDIILESISSTLFQSNFNDPLINYNINKSFKNIWQQLSQIGEG